MTEFQVGDQVIIADDPDSLTVKHHGGRGAVVTEMPTHDLARIQINDMGPVGRRMIFVTDLKPAGQLRLL